MIKINYDEFVEIIGKYKYSFDRFTLIALYEQFGEEVIDKYFDKYYQSLNEEEISDFIDTYSAYFEKIFSDKTEYEKVDSDSVNTLTLMINSSFKYPIMSAEMEKEQGYVLEEAAENLVIAKNINEKFILYPDLDLPKIFLSLKTNDDLEYLNRIKKLPYVLKDEGI